MKKILIVSGIIIGVLMIAGVGAAVALAIDNHTENASFQNEFRGEGRGRAVLDFVRGHNMMEDDRFVGVLGREFMNGDHPLRNYMLDSIASSLGLTSEELTNRIEEGETLCEVAQGQGLSDEEILSIFSTARISALTAAVEAGDLTQAQADFLNERMDNRWQNNPNSFCSNRVLEENTNSQDQP